MACSSRDVEVDENPYDGGDAGDGNSTPWLDAWCDCIGNPCVMCRPDILQYPGRPCSWQCDKFGLENPFLIARSTGLPDVVKRPTCKHCGRYWYNRGTNTMAKAKQLALGNGGPTPPPKGIGCKPPPQLPPGLPPPQNHTEVRIRKLEASFANLSDVTDESICNLDTRISELNEHNEIRIRKLEASFANLSDVTDDSIRNLDTRISQLNVLVSQLIKCTEQQITTQDT
jgi:hypothetical protein